MFLGSSLIQKEILRFSLFKTKTRKGKSLRKQKLAQTLTWNKKRFSPEIKACSQTLYALEEARRKLTQCTASFQSMTCWENFRRLEGCWCRLMLHSVCWWKHFSADRHRIKIFHTPCGCMAPGSFLHTFLFPQRFQMTLSN